MLPSTLCKLCSKTFKSYTLKGGGDHRSFKGGQIAPSPPPLKETLKSIEIIKREGEYSTPYATVHMRCG